MNSQISFLVTEKTLQLNVFKLVEGLNEIDVNKNKQKKQTEVNGRTTVDTFINYQINETKSPEKTVRRVKLSLDFFEDMIFKVKLT